MPQLLGRARPGRTTIRYSASWQCSYTAMRCKCACPRASRRRDGRNRSFELDKRADDPAEFRTDCLGHRVLHEGIAAHGIQRRIEVVAQRLGLGWVELLCTRGHLLIGQG